MNEPGRRAANGDVRIAWHDEGHGPRHERLTPQLIDPTSSTILADVIPEATLVPMPGGLLMSWEHSVEVARRVVTFPR